MQVGMSMSSSFGEKSGVNLPRDIGTGRYCIEALGAGQAAAKLPAS